MCSALKNPADRGVFYFQQATEPLAKLIKMYSPSLDKGTGLTVFLQEAQHTGNFIMAPKENRGGGLVYSTEKGRMCPACTMPKTECVCGSKKGALPGGDGVVRVRRETQGRKGKGVTIISGVPLADADVKELGQRLKKMCGAGGSVKNGLIEIQGDHRDQVMKELEKNGWVVKRSGG
jgi:translation initiation factor 1